MAELANSTYLDLTSYRGNGTLPTGSPLTSAFSFNVALVLERANNNDPTPLLSGSWAERQAALADQTAVFQKYGADPGSYTAVLNELTRLGIQTVDQFDPTNGYVSSVESRTIWVHVDNTNYTTLFGSTAVLRDGGTDSFGNRITFWEGNLSLPDAIVNAGVNGLWFDTSALSTAILADHPTILNGATLPQGPQSQGNSYPSPQFPNAIAAAYNFPFASAELASVPTGRVGLIEPGIGTALPASARQSFDELLTAYRHAAGIDTPLQPTIDVAPGGQHWVDADERSLDVGIVTTVSPQSQLVLYAGSGGAGGAGADAFTAYQAAFWDTTNNPEVVSSSFKSFFPRVTPGSPFYTAMQGLFVDAALRNITVVNAAGDGGSGDEYPNGLTNIAVTHAGPYSLAAGGASLSTISAASHDTTLNGLNAAYPDIYAAAMAGDPSTLWELVAGGLKVLPSSADPTEMLVETAWNQYSVSNDFIHNYLNNSSGSGGVDPSQSQPSYQTAFGLDLHTADPAALAGRGVPDVAATSGGNAGYLVPQPDMTSTQGTGGTSAAAPLWAALTSQVNAIFKDQGLPTLGYMNDLLYIAAAIAPASFNDITLGNNTSSMTLGGTFRTELPKGSPDLNTHPDATTDATPTGYGYSAGPGYDLVTGLGTPNGILLARALTDIAHSQMWFGATPDVLEQDGLGGWQSGADQSLLFQTMSADGATVGIDLGPDAFGFFSTPSQSFAWTSRLAQQVLQPDFDPNLVVLFDKQAQGALVQQHASSGEDLAVSINSASAEAIQGTLTSSFGFADFVSGDGAVRVARAMAVAETAQAHDDQTAIVRLRQNGTDSLSLTFYRVDDLAGTIDGLHPGEAGYQAAVHVRAYQMATGGTSIGGPGYGSYAETGLLHVDAGDLVAMQLTNNSHGNTYYAFAQANETVANETAAGQPVGHLWNYGLNTWGWEDTYGGGDRDYNDMIVQLDFTSASGHGWLA